MCKLKTLSGVFCLLLCVSCVTEYSQLTRWETGNYFITQGDTRLVLVPYTRKYYKLNNGNGIENFKGYAKGVIVTWAESGIRMDNSRYARGILTVIPTIHFISNSTAEEFTKNKMGMTVWISDLTIFENGIKLLINFSRNESDGTAPRFCFFELCNGMYYETTDEQNMGNKLKHYNFFETSIYSLSEQQDPKYYWGYNVERVTKQGKYVETLATHIQYFKPMDNKLLLISPYGAYVYDYFTRYVKLADVNSISSERGFLYSADSKKYYLGSIWEIDFNGIAPE
jgi:hypothetical protein